MTILNYMFVCPCCSCPFVSQFFMSSSSQNDLDSNYSLDQQTQQYSNLKLFVLETQSFVFFSFFSIVPCTSVLVIHARVMNCILFNSLTTPLLFFLRSSSSISLFNFLYLYVAFINFIIFIIFIFIVLNFSSP